MKLLVDMNLSPRWIALLTQAGHEAAHWSDVGSANAADSTIMEHARVNHFVVLTHDLDFSAMLAANRGEKPSVVQIRSQDVDPNVIGKQVLEALRQMTVELDEGALLTVDPKRTRLRLLPLALR